MSNETAFRILSWVLFGAVLLMRFYFIFQLRQLGRRMLLDEQVIAHESKGLFAFRLASWFLMIGVLLSYTLNHAWLDAFRISVPDWLRWLGFLFGLVSILFWTWTQVVLGSEWSPQLHLRKEQLLIARGPYAHIRHPMYTGILGFGVGLALVSANWVFVALVALIVVGLLLRIPREEEMLIAEFGDEYRMYKQRTGSCCPDRRRVKRLI